MEKLKKWTRSVDSTRHIRQNERQHRVELSNSRVYKFMFEASSNFLHDFRVKTMMLMLMYLFT